MIKKEKKERFQSSTVKLFVGPPLQRPEMMQERERANELKHKFSTAIRQYLP